MALKGLKAFFFNSSPLFKDNYKNHNLVPT